MKIISKLGGAALITAMGLSAFGCSKSGAGASVTDAAVSSAPAANAAPVPSPPQSPEDKMPRINVEEAKKLVADGKAIIIDVRGTESYKMSHIKGALDVPITKLESKDFKGLPKDKRIIAYCS